LNGAARPPARRARDPQCRPEIMPLRLRDNLHWCESAGRIVFLDVDADRYFCLPSEVRPAFLALAARQAEPQDTARLGMMTQRGLLVESHSLGEFPQPARIDQPSRDVLDYPVPRSAAVPILRALAWEQRAAWQLRTRAFSEIIANARRRSGETHEVPGDKGPALRSIGAAADAIAFVTRSHNRCLVRGLGVHAACRARGIPAKLVLGVIAHPFAAHCWVQLGDAVLVGGYEHARLHTPILVIG
jgi:hypothetical protein